MNLDRRQLRDLKGKPRRLKKTDLRDNVRWNRADSNTSSSSTTTGSERTPPNCGRCKNHFLDIPLKNHKRYCMWKDCTCPLCELVITRRKVMKEQTALRRAMAQEKEKVMDVAEVKPLALTEPASIVNLNRICNKSHRTNGEVPDFVSVSPSSQKRSSEAQFKENVELLLECSMKLLQLFQYSWYEYQHAIPLMYVILKMARADLNQARRLIMDANNEIRRLAFWDNFREFHAHNVYDASHYNGYVTLRDTVDSPPTYLDQPPFIGTVPPIPTAHQRLLAHPPNPHIIMTEGSSGLDSPPERSIDSGRSTVGVACGPLDMGTSTRD